MQTASHTMDVELTKHDVTATSGLQKKSSFELEVEKLKSSMPTIYPNDYEFSASAGFGFNSTTSRSFVRPAKQIGQEHRNISVPNSLKVC